MISTVAITNALPVILAELGAAFVLGFLGSLHCVGMCGGFALVSGAGANGTGRNRGRVFAYLAGKTLTYAALGALVAGLFNAVPTNGSAIQRAIGILTGAFLILSGLHMAGLGPSWLLVAPGPAVRLVARMGETVRRASTGGRFVLGLLNGLLPCGLLYAALGFSTTMATAWEGALFMSAFGLGTMPALAAVGLGATLLAATRRRAIYQGLGWLVVAMGLLTTFRASGLMRVLMGGM